MLSGFDIRDRILESDNSYPVRTCVLCSSIVHTGSYVHDALDPVHDSIDPVYVSIHPVHDSIDHVHDSIDPVHDSVSPCFDHNFPLFPLFLFCTFLFADVV